MISSLLWNRWGPHAPRIELCRFKKIEFFPKKPLRLDALSSICIGSKTRTIGDALMLSTLPAKLKALHPKLRVYTYPRGFNPVVFAGNPHVDGVQWLPEALYGDDCNEGMGHLIQLKEHFFGLQVSSHAKPELHLRPSEKRWIGELVRPGLPLCLVHPWGKTHASVLSSALWSRIVAEWADRFRFWQVGIEGHEKIPGCEHHLLLPRAFPHARRLFAAMSRADLFIGVDSGPMHVARAFGIPSLILTDYGASDSAIFAERWQKPHHEHKDWNRFFIYEGNAHIDVPGIEAAEIQHEIGEFLKKSL